MPPAATPAALDTGRIDAAVLTEPLLSQTLNSGLARVLGKPYDTIAPRFMIAAVVAMTEFINANKDAVQRFSRASPGQRVRQRPSGSNRTLACRNHEGRRRDDHRGHRELFDETSISSTCKKSSTPPRATRPSTTLSTRAN